MPRGPCPRHKAVLMTLTGRRSERSRNMTRILVIVGALAASTLLGGWGFDRQGPYCLFDREFTNCGYDSFASCVAASRGVGGLCRQNPMFNPHRQPRRWKSY